MLSARAALCLFIFGLFFIFGQPVLHSTSTKRMKPRGEAFGHGSLVCATRPGRPYFTTTTTTTNYYYYDYD